MPAPREERPTTEDSVARVDSALCVVFIPLDEDVETEDAQQLREEGGVVWIGVVVAVHVHSW